MDVIARGVATLVSGAAYGDVTPYITVPAADYTLDIDPAIPRSGYEVRSDGPRGRMTFSEWLGD